MSTCGWCVPGGVWWCLVVCGWLWWCYYDHSSPYWLSYWHLLQWTRLITQNSHSNNPLSGGASPSPGAQVAILLQSPHGQEKVWVCLCFSLNKPDCNIEEFNPNCILYLWSCGVHSSTAGEDQDVLESKYQRQGSTGILIISLLHLSHVIENCSPPPPPSSPPFPLPFWPFCCRKTSLASLRTTQRA